MEKPFWSSGPVPPAHLDLLALPRPRATAELVAAVGLENWAWVGGASGSGRTTLLHQAAKALGRPLLVIDLRCMLKGDAAEALGHVVQQGPKAKPAPETWDAAVEAWAPDAALAFDGYHPASHPWVRDVAEEAKRPVLAAGEGPILPDVLQDAAVQGFLERRSRRVRVDWTGAALREAVELIDGDAAAMQRVGASALRTCIERGARRVLMEDVLDAAVEVAHQSSFGASAWRRLDGPRRALLLAMSRDPDAPPTSWARRCSLEPKAAVVHLGRLVEAGLVSRAGRGQYVLAPLLRIALQPSGGSLVRLVRPAGPFTTAAGH